MGWRWVTRGSVTKRGACRGDARGESRKNSEVGEDVGTRLEVCGENDTLLISRFRKGAGRRKSVSGLTLFSTVYNSRA